MELDSTSIEEIRPQMILRENFFYQVGNIQPVYCSNALLSREVADETNLTLLFGLFHRLDWIILHSRKIHFSLEALL